MTKYQLFIGKASLFVEHHFSYKAFQRASHNRTPCQRNMSRINISHITTVITRYNRVKTAARNNADYNLKIIIKIEI